MTYARATLADPATGTRVTIDLGVRATRGDQAVEVDLSHLIVETKGARTPGTADELLKQLRRPPVLLQQVRRIGVPDGYTHCRQ